MISNNRSVWWDDVERPQFPTVNQDMRTDVLIIGGGITGILCAYMLKKAGVDSILVEAGEICSGITKNTTAKITFQHGLIYDRLIRSFGLERARLYMEANRSALNEYRELSKKIACDFEEKNNFVYSINDREKIEKEVIALEKIGIPTRFIEEVPLPFAVAGAVMVERQAQFHPLKFLYQIAEGLPIFERTKVLELQPNEVVTGGGRIRAEKIIVATHFPFLNKHGGYFLKLYQHRSCVLALRNAENVKGMYVDEKDTGMSFRNYNDLLFVGGGGHRTGKRGGGWRELERYAGMCYPQATIVGRWATQDCMTLDGVPYIGAYSKGTKDLYVATGYNKWGMSSAMAAALILSEMVQGKKSPYEELFSPSRSMMRKQLLINGGEAFLGMVTPTAPRCPHMGCALKYNKEEHSWDCSCHGSRFEGDGRLIDNPAADDKRDLGKYIKGR